VTDPVDERQGNTAVPPDDPAAVAAPAAEVDAVPPATAPDGGAPEPPPVGPSGKSLTIGAVCKALGQEFPDISISKIRYLEDQKLLAPRRTPGGYRLYSANDVSRLRTILRLQRDEFLPLRVIRQELAAGRSEPEMTQSPEGGAAAHDARPGAALRRLTFSIAQRGSTYSLEDVIEDTGAEARLIAELEDFGIIKGEARAGTKFYDETQREIVRAVSELARYGVAGRNLRVFKTSAERESALLQQILAPGLRSRNPERRKEAVEALENLAAVASHLKHLLLVRDLRRIAR
jgi:DNA-binding transcriptional MerR regulator